MVHTVLIKLFFEESIRSRLVLILGNIYFSIIIYNAKTDCKNFGKHFILDHGFFFWLRIPRNGKFWFFFAIFQIYTVSNVVSPVSKILTKCVYHEINI